MSGIRCCGCCCSSLRGAAYFSSSVQIFAGAYLFLKWVVSTFGNGIYDKYLYDVSRNTLSDRLQIIYPLLLIYIFLFIVLGLLSFLAIDKKWEGLLKWTTWLLLGVQFVELLSHILLGFLFPDPEDDLDMSRMFHLKFITLNFLGSIVYFILMFTYIGMMKRSYSLGQSQEDELDNNPTLNKRKGIQRELDLASAPLSTSIEEPNPDRLLSFKKTQV